MPDVNTDTNQSPKTINKPDADKEKGVENPPASSADQKPNPPTQPDEHVPPVEVPGRPETPEHVPEKDAAAFSYPTLVKA